MKKIMLSALCILLCVSLFACGEKEPQEQTIFGPVTMTDGSLALEGVKLGESQTDARKILEQNGYTVTSDTGEGIEVIFDDVKIIDGIKTEELMYSDYFEDDTISMFSMTIPHMSADVDSFNDMEVFKKDIEAYLSGYKNMLSGMENALLTKGPSGGTEEGEEIVFDIPTELYTFVFVDGEAVKVSSRREAFDMKDAQILEVYFVGPIYTQSEIDMIKSDPAYKNGEAILNPAYLQVIAGTSEAFNAAY